MADEQDDAGLYHPRFPPTWCRVPLYGLANWANGLAFRDVNFSSTGRPVIKIAEVKTGISQQTKFTTQTFDDAIRVRFGDLIFSWSGQPETSIDAFWWRGPEGWLNQHLFRVTPIDIVDRTFFYYLLRYLNPHFVRIARNKQTTGLGHVTKRDLEAIEVGIPPLSEQRAIAEVLGALDDKIEANARVVDAIDGLVRVEVAAALTDAQREVSLGDLLQRVSEIAKPHELDEMSLYVGLEHMPRGSLFLKSWGSGEALASAKARFRPGDILFGRLRPYFKKVAVAPSLGVCSTDVLVLRPKVEEQAAFATVVCASDEVVDYASRGSEGTRMPRVSWDYLSRFRVPLPADADLVGLDRRIAPLFHLGIHLPLESIALARLRDTLLPKLVSGELGVRDAESLVEAVV
jgi:type I restriction enzyme S subunit